MYYSPERRYEHEGAVYMIRDVMNSDGSFSGRCEYAASGNRWLPCREGVNFSEIQPLEYAMPAKRNWVV